jgi:hypothetical protein
MIYTGYLHSKYLAICPYFNYGSAILSLETLPPEIPVD